MATPLIDIFSDIPDPRVERTRDHKLIDIVMITLAAVICGSKSWYDIEEFGHVRHDWLKGFLELPEGIPSHDTFNRFFSAIDNRILEERFVRWVSSISEKRTGVVAIDGKCLKSSRKKGSCKHCYTASTTLVCTCWNCWRYVTQWQTYLVNNA